MDDIQILSPSYKRHDRCFTHQILPSLKYVVCESQAEEYEKRGLPLLVCPDSAQGNISRIRNWILDNMQTEKLLMIDDDMKYIGIWKGNKHKKLNSEETEDFIRSGFQLAEEFDVKYWGINIIADKGAYREYTPFSLRSVILGPFGGFFRDFEPRCEERLALKEDYDLSIQALNKYRKILRINFAHYVCKQHTNIGGCATYRTIEKEMHLNKLLEQKWGSKIVKTDAGNRKNQKRETTFDINPIIKIPIGGV